MDSEFFTPTAKPTHVKGLVVGLFLTLIILNLPDFLAAYSETLLLFLWGALILISLIAEIFKRFTKIYLEEKGITVKRGILNIKKVFIQYQNIANINVHQSIFERILSVGSLEIDTAGTSKAEVLIHSIDYKYLQKVVERTKKSDRL